MSINEIESAVTKLSGEDLAQFAAWFAEFHAQAWDEQIAVDLESGRFNRLLKEVDAEYDAGEAKPL